MSCDNVIHDIHYISSHQPASCQLQVGWSQPKSLKAHQALRIVHVAYNESPTKGHLSRKPKTPANIGGILR